MVAPRRPVSKDLNTVVMQSISRSVSMLGGAAIVLLTCANICTLAENIWCLLTRRSPPRPPTTPPPSGEFSAFSRSSCSRMDWNGNISLLFIVGLYINSHGAKVRHYVFLSPESTPRTLVVCRLSLYWLGRPPGVVSCKC